PVFALMSGLSTALLGHEGMARTVVVVGALPLATWGVYRLVRGLTSAPLPAAFAATAYVVNPAGRDAIGRGDIGPLVLFALAPWVVHALVRATAGRRGALHAVVVVGLLGAVAAAAWPPAILFPILLAFALALSTLFTWGDWAPLRTATLA